MSAALQYAKSVLVGGMSRSGTTLLSAVLDAHPQISAGAELIPVPIEDLKAFRALYATARQETPEFEFAGRTMRRAGESRLGGVVTRSYRAGLTAEQFEAVLDGLIEAGQADCVNFLDRVDFAMRLIAQRVAAEGVEYGSFKLNSPSLEPVVKHYPNAKVLFLVRHPAAVAHSQLTKGFSDDARKVIDIWGKYVAVAVKAAAAYPEQVTLVQYEGLVHNPEETLRQSFAPLGLPFSDQMLEYQRQKSAIFESRHPNTEHLKKGFDPSATAIDYDAIDASIPEAVKTLDTDLMARFEYN